VFGSKIGGTCTFTEFGDLSLAATTKTTGCLVFLIFSVKVTTTLVAGLGSKPRPLSVIVASGGAERVLSELTLGSLGGLGAFASLSALPEKVGHTIVGAGLGVAVGDNEGASIGVGSAVGVAVGVLVAVGVAVAVAVAVGVEVTVGVSVGVECWLPLP
jgi:hypothetical protein